MDDPATLSLAEFATRPRRALMWVPRAADVARLAAVARAGNGRVLDAGAGAGLLARLLADAGCDVVAVDARDANGPTPSIGRFFAVADQDVATAPAGPFALAVVSWMEAGRDYRAEVAQRADAVATMHDPAGGCGGVAGVGFEDFGLTAVASWSTPSHEDVAFALRSKGRGLVRPGAPGNVVTVWAKPGVGVPLARAGLSAYPWEPELDALGF